MPELPEVETVRDGLARHVLGARVTGAEVMRDYSVRRQDGGPEAFRSQVLGSTITAAVRRGKYLWLLLDGPDGAPGDHALLAHLGMSGQLLVSQPALVTERHRHLRVRLELEGPQGPLVLDFVDQRTFGYLAVTDLVPTDDDAPGGLGAQRPAVPELVAHVGRDLLDPHLDRTTVSRRMRGRRSGIKRVLLDQTLISGVGNIYADEALWRVGLHGERPSNRLTAKVVAELLDAAHDVMSEALVAGGTSFDALYVNVDGESGYFARGLSAYGREGEPCYRCGGLLVREVFMNRSSFSCPVCQRRPRATNRK